MLIMGAIIRTEAVMRGPRCATETPIKGDRLRSGGRFTIVIDSLHSCHASVTLFAYAIT